MVKSEYRAQAGLQIRLMLQTEHRAKAGLQILAGSAVRADKLITFLSPLWLLHRPKVHLLMHPAYGFRDVSFRPVALIEQENPDK